MRLKPDTLTLEDSVDPLLIDAGWHKVFLWLPAGMINGEVRWLETVYRKVVSWHHSRANNSDVHTWSTYIYSRDIFDILRDG